jgi:cysteinyl-tRNA synthetase
MLKLYNTLSRKKEPFKPIKGKEVGMYNCGPTVYFFAHIGNLRTFTNQDLLNKYLRFSGYKVKYVMNLTDVDDKTIAGSKKENISLREFTTKYSNLFLADLAALRIQRPDVIVRATDTIPEMVALIEKLLKKGVAYKSEDGSIYYNIKKFKNYGKLSKLKMKELKAGARVNQQEYEKEQASDFVLWKAWTEADGAVFWETKIGKGRPGWHIECSTMSMKYLGEHFDIHGGGIDLIFPHHENEIAQSEGATGKQFVNYWLHCQHLIVNGRKMSKSLGNFYTLHDLSSYGPRAVRLIFLSAHYREELNFTFDALSQAQKTLDKFDDFVRKLKDVKSGAGDKSVAKLIDETKVKIIAAIDNDLNTPIAWATIFDFMKKINSSIDAGKLGKTEAEKVIAFLKELDSIFSIFEFEFSDKIEPELLDLLEKRKKAKNDKDYAEADRLRALLQEKGISVADTKDGQRWKRI